MPHVSRTSSGQLLVTAVTKIPIWEESHYYTIGEFVYIDSESIDSSFSTGIFVCNQSHTSGSDFDTDISKWDAINGSYTHVQSTPSTSWSVSHNLNKKPSVTIYDADNNEIEAEIEYITDNSLSINFNQSKSGFAYIM